jgi:hypothetical protein
MDGLPPPRMPVSRVRVRVKPNNSPVEYRFNAGQHRFLEAYAETLDMDVALKAGGLRLHQINKNPYIQAEMERLQECAMFKHRAKATVGNHHRLMNRVEKMMDQSGDMRVKQGFAGVLARMSDTALKAAGEYTENSGGNVQLGPLVIMNFGAPVPEPEKPIAIDITPHD